MKKNILVVAAHPDDEIIGVGGTVRRLVDSGYNVYALILGEGATSRTTKREQTDRIIIKRLHEDTLSAAKVIGYKEVFFEDLPDNRFDSIDLLNIIKKVEYYIRKLHPERVFTHHNGDLNIDHRCTCDAVLTACRPVNKCSVKEIDCFETLSSTEWNFADRNTTFHPNLFIDISKTLNAKLKAMSEYKSELCRFPHPRSMRALEAAAVRWGSVAGHNATEAFVIILRIE